MAISILLFRNRALRKRPGNVPMRVRPHSNQRWSPGHGVWIHDVFVVRGIPAAWKEALVWATAAEVRVADDEERKRLHRIGDAPIIVTLSLVDGGTIELAARAEHEGDLLGPSAPADHLAFLTVPT